MKLGNWEVVATRPNVTNVTSVTSVTPIEREAATYTCSPASIVLAGVRRLFQSSFCALSLRVTNVTGVTPRIVVATIKTDFGT